MRNQMYKQISREMLEACAMGAPPYDKQDWQF